MASQSTSTGHVFISYTRKDQPYTRKLAGSLRQRGLEVWMDDRIDFGDRWWREIVKAIRASAAFIIVMTPDSEESEWVEREIRLALRERKPIFPLLLRGQENPLLITIQYADVTGGRLPPDDFYERLAQQVARSKPKVGQRPSTRQVHPVDKSTSSRQVRTTLDATKEHLTAEQQKHREVKRQMKGLRAVLAGQTFLEAVKGAGRFFQGYAETLVVKLDTRPDLPWWGNIVSWGAAILGFLIVGFIALLILALVIGLFGLDPESGLSIFLAFVALLISLLAGVVGGAWALAAASHHLGRIVEEEES